MNDKQWQRVLELYEVASGLNANAARALLDSSGEEPAVLSEVAAMLERADRTAEPDAEEAVEQFAGLSIGRYRVLTRIGRGTTGDVYAGLDTSLGRRVALKFVSPDVTGGESAARRMIREAQAASALNHPNIVTVHEVLTHDSSPVIVMELVEGSPLRALCGEPLPWDRAIRIGSQILQALAAAHAAGITHRDLKPENVMVRPDGYVKVLDLGLARRTFDGTGNLSSNTGLPVGTLRYMSPEQTRGETATPASDIFAAGIVLYEISTGRHPFYADSPLDTAHAIVWKEPDSPAALRAEMPPTVSSLILRMLAKNPADRPSAGDAHQVLAALPGVAPKRKRRIAVAAGIAGAALAAAAGITIWAGAGSRSTKLPELIPITRQAIENHVTASALSPDGKSLAFADYDGAVHLRNIEGTSDRVVTRLEDGRVDTIRWIAGQPRLLLSSRDLSSDSYSYQLSTLDLESGLAKRLPIAGKQAAASLDGNRIAYFSPNGAELWVADSGGDQPRRLVVSRTGISLKFFAWSGDSDLIHYWEASEGGGRQTRWAGWKMFTLNPATGRIAGEQTQDKVAWPFVLPGGRLLYGDQNIGIWEVRIDPATGRFTGSPQKRTEPPNMLLEKDLTASADGQRIAGIFRSRKSPRVYVADLRPGDSRVSNARRLALEDTEDYPHSWTPDSTAVVVESSRRQDFDVFVHRIDRKNALHLVAMPDTQVTPMVSPDGRWVLFLSGGLDHPASGPRGWRLMRVPIGGGPPELVPTGGPVQEFYCGYRAKRCVLREMQNDQSVFFDLDPIRGKGRELTRSATGAIVFGDWSVSPDGSMVATTNISKLPATIRVTYLDQAPLEKEISLDGPAPVGGAMWTPDGRGWYVAVQDQQMRLVDWNGKNRFVHDVDYWMVPSWDGKHLAFLDRERDLNVWMLGQ